MATFDDVRVFANATGLFADLTGSIAVRDSIAENNTATGVHLAAAGTIAAENNVAANNATGFFFNARSATAPGVIVGNVARNNTTGMQITSYTVIGSGEADDNSTGVYLDAAALGAATGITIRNNATGGANQRRNTVQQPPVRQCDGRRRRWNDAQ